MPPFFPHLSVLYVRRNKNRLSVSFKIREDSDLIKHDPRLETSVPKKWHDVKFQGFVSELKSTSSTRRNFDNVSENTLMRKKVEQWNPDVFFKKVELHGNSNATKGRLGRHFEESIIIAKGGNFLLETKNSFLSSPSKLESNICILPNVMFIDISRNPSSSIHFKRKTEYIDLLLKHNKYVIDLNYPYAHTNDNKNHYIKRNNENIKQLNERIKDCSYTHNSPFVISHYFGNLEPGDFDIKNGAHLSFSGYNKITEFIHKVRDYIKQI